MQIKIESIRQSTKRIAQKKNIPSQFLEEEKKSEVQIEEVNEEEAESEGDYEMENVDEGFGEVEESDQIESGSKLG